MNANKNFQAIQRVVVCLRKEITSGFYVFSSFKVSLILIHKFHNLKFRLVSVCVHIFLASLRIKRCFGIEWTWKTFFSSRRSRVSRAQHAEQLRLCRRRRNTYKVLRAREKERVGWFEADGNHRMLKDRWLWSFYPEFFSFCYKLRDARKSLVV